ncbi:PREDICTED: uncharacterized protein LOC108557761 [Nicrophorus vespilloides]|uniref:Uncharacterized protein LOC108557761 n=1 Tax=Nicrophorus vespilloides TaxID=110193 RepID=A0ABM1M5Q3_NICVS|nr:PREDICTED: uncharacterized protein LOC108557761 [Nicrophorus vespilloides]
MNLWNKRDLKAPPICTYLEERRSLDLTKLSINLNNAEVVYKSQKHLEMEAALLSRCLYLVKTKYRMFKFVRGLEKVNQGLLRYLQYDFQKDLSDFVATMPKQYETQTYFPSRNMLDHLLVKLQGVAKLFCRIGECALDAAATINEYLTIGHLWQMLLLFFGISARIFAIMKHLLKLTCQLYNDLIELRRHFQNTDVQWLTEDYEFPNDLNNFVDATWLNEDVILKPIDGTALQLQENSTQLLDEMKKHNDAVLEQMPLELLQANKDVGDAIECRKSNVKKTSTVGNVKSKQKLVYKDNIFTNKIMAFNSIDELRLYIKLQNKMCNINIKKSDFRHLDKMQWNILYNATKKLINKCCSQKEKNFVKKVKECLVQSFS